MEHSLFLRQYKYEIPASTPAIKGLPKGELGQVNQEPALCAFFDFENGGFQLEGDYLFLSNANNRQKNFWHTRDKIRIFIEAKMKPEIPAGPNDNLRNELLLTLKGSIYNGEQKYRCSGLLRLNRSWKSNKAQWMIYCSVMDNDLDVFEIRLNLPVITSLVQTPGYN
jgi:hypothetical protein